MTDYKTNKELAASGFLECCDALCPVILAAMEVPVRIDFCILTTSPSPCVSVTVSDLDSYRALVVLLRETCGEPDYEDQVIPLDQEDGTCSYIHDIRFGPVRISCTADDIGSGEVAPIW